MDRLKIATALGILVLLALAAMLVNGTGSQPFASSRSGSTSMQRASPAALMPASGVALRKVALRQLGMA